MLLDSGANPNPDSPQKPLDLAALYNHPDSIRLLIHAGADPLARDNGKDALDIALENNSRESVEILLDVSSVSLDQLEEMFQRVEEKESIFSWLQKQTLVGRLGPKKHYTLVEALENLKMTIRELDLPKVVQQKKLSLTRLFPHVDEYIRKTGTQVQWSRCEQYSSLAEEVLRDDRDLRSRYPEFFELLETLQKYIRLFCR